MIRSGGLVPVAVADRSELSTAYTAARQAIHRGERFVIFPEGTRSKDGRLAKLNNGAFRLAIETRTDITPVFFTIDAPYLNGHPSTRWSRGFRTLKAVIETPISVALAPANRQGVEILKREFIRRYEVFCGSTDVLAWNDHD